MPYVIIRAMLSPSAGDVKFDGAGKYLVSISLLKYGIAGWPASHVLKSGIRPLKKMTAQITAKPTQNGRLQSVESIAAIIPIAVTKPVELAITKIAHDSLPHGRLDTASTAPITYAIHAVKNSKTLIENCIAVVPFGNPAGQ